MNIYEASILIPRYWYYFFRWFPLPSWFFLFLIFGRRNFILQLVIHLLVYLIHECKLVQCLGPGHQSFSSRYNFISISICADFICYRRLDVLSLLLRRIFYFLVVISTFLLKLARFTTSAALLCQYRWAFLLLDMVGLVPRAILLSVLVQ